MKIVEIFNSIEGEGYRQGALATFVRFGGCNLTCPYCDTKYSWKGHESEWKEMSVNEILDEVSQYKCRNITLTGGEPLIQSDAINLIDVLTSRGYLVNIETNGSVDILRIFYSLGRPEYAWFTIDYKGPSSGQEDRMCATNFEWVPNTTYRRYHVMYKFVVGTIEDLDKAREITKQMDKTTQIFISPIWGQIEPKEIVKYMQKYSKETVNWKLQLQMHKIIWDPAQRGV